MEIAGWKDVLRPIRDGFRHLFPSPDTGPAPEERARQRELDRLKGFCYFDTFEQLEAWHDTEVDPIQRANTPLLPRSAENKSFVGSGTKVLLCHDYAGNYHDYESSQGAGVGVKSYFCEHMQFVDTFIYFSHKLVCVPPASWVNTLHRNGVRALGTVLIEPQTGDAGRLLRHDSAFHFPLADTLASIAQCYGFEGWLINIEKPFENNTWDSRILEGFLEQLKQKLGPDRKLIWYDALTRNNKVKYQNALTIENLPFSEKCGAVLTNYTWTEAKAERSKHLAVERGMDPEEVHMGIDVWAQNTTKSTHPRVTYPKQHGGGTYTGIAVSELGEFGLSAAVFAPAWTFEHFPGHEHVAERALWDGEIIPEDMECACGKALEIHPRGKALAAFARQFAAGSQQYFYTDFARAFGCHRDGLSKWLYDGKRMHSQLAAQSILPYMALTSGFDVVDRLDNAVNILCMVLDDSPGHTYLLVQVGSVIPPGENAEQFYERLLPLFRVDMTPVGPLRFKVGYKGMISLPETTATFYLKFTTGIAFISLIEGDGLREIEGPVLHGEISSSTRLIEVGVYLKSRPIEERLTVVEITGIHIGPLVKMQGTCKIENIRTELRSNGDEQHWRLCWDIFDKNEEAIISAGQPYSLITGPFSYFTINIDGISARSYALEWVVFQSMVELMAGRVVEASITGIGFGGQRLAYAASAVRIS